MREQLRPLDYPIQGDAKCAFTGDTPDGQRQCIWQKDHPWPHQYWSGFKNAQGQLVKEQQPATDPESFIRGQEYERNVQARKGQRLECCTQMATAQCDHPYLDEKGGWRYCPWCGKHQQSFKRGAFK